MRIVVCVKRSFPSDQSVVIDESGLWILKNADSNLPSLGRYDELAVEQALSIRDKNEETTVEVITVGPTKDSAILRRAMGMGACSGIHVMTNDECYISPKITANRLSQVIGPRGYDLIMTGAMSDDMAQGLVGPMLAEMLGIRCVTSTADVLLNNQETIVVKRDIEGASRQVLEIDLPALVTVQGCSNNPRYPSLSNIMRANSQALQTVDQGEVTENLSVEALVKLVYPEKNRSIKFLRGSSADKATELVSILKTRGLLS